MANVLINLRIDAAERDRWKAAAENDGKNLSSFVRLAVNDSIAALKAKDLPRVEEQEPSAEPGSVKATAYPQTKRRCTHRLMPGTYCKRCGTTR